MTESLKNIIAVHSWLKDSGYEVSRSAVYLHRSEGKIKADERGRFPIRTVERYAKRWLSGNGGGGVSVSVDIDDLQEKKLRAEADKLTAQARHWQLIERADAIEHSAIAVINQANASTPGLLRRCQAYTARNSERTTDVPGN